MLLPGPEAMQLAIYAGWLLHGTRGALLAGLGFCLPAIVLLLALCWIYVSIGHLGAVAGVLTGFKPVVVAIIFAAMATIGRRALRVPLHLVLAAAAFIAIHLFGVPFPSIVVCALVIGILASRSRARAASMSATGAWPRLSSRYLAVWLALSLLPLLAIELAGGHALFASVYGFFTKAAFVTFGGAYAVLAYVNQAAVEHYGWLTAEQAIDGFALAETTPGPLIVVLQFVGFLAGWSQAGESSPGVAATVAALLTSYATFLPSFFFILVGAPYVERLRDVPWLERGLAAVTAAVVGVILNLGVVFGTAVLWTPAGLDVFATALVATAALALWRKVPVPWVVLGGGLAGLLSYFGGWT